MKTWHLGHIAWLCAHYFPNSILIKLKVNRKNTTLWSFSPYFFLFLVWFEFHIVFIFLHSLHPHPETTEGFSMERKVLYHTSWLVPVSSSLGNKSETLSQEKKEKRKKVKEKRGKSLTWKP